MSPGNDIEKSCPAREVVPKMLRSLSLRSLRSQESPAITPPGRSLGHHALRSWGAIVVAGVFDQAIDENCVFTVGNTTGNMMIKHKVLWCPMDSANWIGCVGFIGCIGCITCITTNLKAFQNFAFRVFSSTLAVHTSYGSTYCVLQRDVMVKCEGHQYICVSLV
jgi:hypothetical protein